MWKTPNHKKTHGQKGCIPPGNEGRNHAMVTQEERSQFLDEPAWLLKFWTRPAWSTILWKTAWWQHTYEFKRGHRYVSPTHKKQRTTEHFQFQILQWLQKEHAVAFTFPAELFSQSPIVLSGWPSCENNSYCASVLCRNIFFSADFFDQHTIALAARFVMCLPWTLFLCGIQCPIILVWVLWSVKFVALGLRYTNH